MLGRYLFFLFFFICIQDLGLAQTTITRQRSIDAADVIGRWLTSLTGPRDFYSATPVAPRRPGKKFFIIKEPAKQYASDYGTSFQYAPLSDPVKSAYQLLGQNPNSLTKALQINRINLAFGIHNVHDIFLNYLYAEGEISGFGLGYKGLIFNLGPLYISYRFQYGQSKVQNYFTSQQINSDLSASLYFRLIDIYTGIRHSFGRFNFETPNRPLQLPEQDFFDQAQDLELFHGITLALSTGLRLSVFMANKRDHVDYGAKLSFHFDSLLPTRENYFKDPRYLKN